MQRSAQAFSATALMPGRYGSCGLGIGEVSAVYRDKGDIVSIAIATELCRSECAVLQKHARMGCAHTPFSLFSTA